MLGMKCASFLACGPTPDCPQTTACPPGANLALVPGSFLPILGFWMIPLGLVILSIDVPIARRLKRRLVVKIGSQMIDGSIRTKLNMLAQAMRG